MRIILFDGICNLCSGAVAFVIKKDKKALFRFAAMQSEAGQAILRHHHLPGDTAVRCDVNTTFYYIRERECFQKSSAVLEVLRDLGGIWKTFYVLHYIPVRVRDAVYLFVSRNRYRWFGKRKSCGIPMAGVRDRFIVSDERIDAQSSKLRN